MKDKIRESIEEYNYYRSPEANAKLIEVKEDSGEFTVEFKGVFCVTCGYYDWFDDLRYILLEKGLKTKIVEIKEVKDGGIVKYKVDE